MATTTSTTVRISARAGAIASAVRVTTTVVHCVAPKGARMGADQ